MTEIKATLKDHCGSDITVVNAARVSFGKESEPEGWGWYEYESGKASGDFIAVLNEKDQKLIRYLAQHKHLSPFGHCFASFHVKAPIFVARQLVKHKFLRWNEISRRYVDEEPEFYVPDVWRGRSADKKQGSSDDIVLDDGWYPDDFASNEDVSYNDWGGECFKWSDPVMALGVYNKMIDAGVAPEQARMVLPQSTMTEWWWSGSLDAFASMCNLRLPSDTQYESRLVAKQVSEVMRELFPVSWASLVTSKERSDGVPLSKEQSDESVSEE